MSLRNGMYTTCNTPNSHMDPCSEPGFMGGKFMKLGTTFLVICLMGMTASVITNKLNPPCARETDLQEELAGIKSQICAMKDNVQFIIKAKKDTSKMIDEVNGMFRDIKKIADPEKIASCGHNHFDDVKDGGLNRIVERALVRYSNDKTGMADYALESAGGSIASTRNTVDYDEGNIVTFFGWLLCSGARGARAMIQPGALPGECWAFKGSSGQAVIKLIAEIYISGITLEHITKAVAPSNDVRSAPKEFSVWGLTCQEEKDADFLGRYVYNVEAPPVQYFRVEKCPEKRYRYAEIRFHSNYGHPEYTCVYRIRIHGTTDKPNSSMHI